MTSRNTLRVHNAKVLEQMHSEVNRLHTEQKLGRKPRLEFHEDRNALALQFIESGAIDRFSANHRFEAEQNSADE